MLLYTTRASVCPTLPLKKERSIDRTHGTIGRVLRPVPSALARHTAKQRPTKMFSLSATQARSVGTTPRATTRRPPSRGTAVVVRAEEKASAPAAEKAPWTAPKLNPNTPSPIFGGSTGGLLRKAQVRIRFSFNDFFCDGWMDGSDGGRRRDGRSGR